MKLLRKIEKWFDYRLSWLFINGRKTEAWTKRLMEKYPREIVLVRGIPGSGKSTFARLLGGQHIESDMFFMKNGKYQFNPKKLKQAHRWCQHRVEDWMKTGQERIVVSNTFTQEWEMESYFKLAKTYGYKISTVIAENRHGGQNTHNVPQEILDAMHDRFEVKLR